jgi:hypothetical protein
MFQSIPRSLILFAALCSVVQITSATQPPDPSPSSDSAFNTAYGNDALQFLSSGSDNTAVGYNALFGNRGGNSNTALGEEALPANVSGSFNVAVGSAALNLSVASSGNVAIGNSALGSNNGSTGYNTAIGYQALGTDPSGNYSTAVGAYSLASVTSGSIGYNTGFGAFTLNVNSSGSNNTAFGYAALRSTTTGDDNIGFGYQSLYLDAAGSNNIAMGYRAAYNIVSGSNTIEIGNQGEGADNALIRIGAQGTQTSTYIAGIAGAQVTGSAVYVTSSGQLGVLASSERYKTAIAPMGGSTDKLAQLRPVSFHLKTDSSATTQYGLIAEEVAKVYPELVIRDGGGVIQGVRYEELAPMLLNEMQKQEQTIADQGAEIRELKKMVLQMRAGLSESQQRNELVARR